MVVNLSASPIVYEYSLTARLDLCLGKSQGIEGLELARVCNWSLLLRLLLCSAADYGSGCQGLWTALHLNPVCDTKSSTFLRHHLHLDDLQPMAEAPSNPVRLASGPFLTWFFLS